MALKSYEELIKVDVRQYCEERDGFTYLNWAKCIELLRQNGATEVYWEPIPDPQTGSSLRKTDIEFKDKDKAWYKEYYKIKYSDAYEVYGLTRTGCCGCPISYKAVEDLEKIRKYEPNVVKAAWNIFGKSYKYRMKYNEYKKKRMEEEKRKAENVEGQMTIFDFPELIPEEGENDGDNT